MVVKCIHVINSIGIYIGDMNLTHGLGIPCSIEDNRLYEVEGKIWKQISY